ncbi:Calcium-independent phospholipase A2-gamma [Chelonia mydas]|uniref:Calcium-independent phospholipase A2-gamma n=1 Tax=Chelonia mydas TaxID=8469 RepID=M7BZD1_CHEMY|nr:Calcium-independent phospholipase A2-gamma [Chelonia mydas]
MSVNLPLNAYFYLLINTRSLWGKQRNKQLYYLCRPKLYWRISHGIPLRVFHTSKTQCKWTRSKTLNCSKHIYSHDFLYYRVSKHSTSSPKGLTKVNNRMSRIKNTFESVSKAVSGTHSELLARIARFKPNSGTLGKAFENNVQENNLQVNLENDKQTTCAGAQGDYNSLAVKNFVHTDENSESTLISRSCTNQDTLKDSVDIKNNLFHVSYFMTNFGETYNFLANHINWYFGNNTVMDQEKKGNAFLQDSKNELRNKLDSPESDIMSNENRMNSASALISAAEIQGADKTNTALPASTKKSIASFLSYPSNSVQAFVDSYVGSLVPKLRFETKAASEDKLQEREESLKDEEDGIKEIKTAEGKEKRLSLQREKASICLVTPLTSPTPPVPGPPRTPLTSPTPPVPGPPRGLVALQTLHKLEELTGKPVHELFDYVCGVSTGAILAFMLGLFHIPLDECEELYHKLGSDVFKQNVIVGTMKMGWSHAFYDSDIWEKMLKDRMGSDLMIETARNPKCPKVAAVSTIVNRGTPLKAFVFRNYNHFPGVKSHYIGGCQYKLWQAIRASSAAPGYFQEYALGNDLHQDGGLLLNNPTALAVHECKCLWPNVPLQCVISLGTGRYESERKNSITYTSLKTKLTNVISSATDTEEVHTMLDGLLPPDTYFRFNPLMNEDIPLDENRKEKLNQLRTDGIRYLERNEEKIKKAARILTQEKTVLQRFNEWIRLKAYMCEGLPFLSKL